MKTLSKFILVVTLAVLFGLHLGDTKHAAGVRRIPIPLLAEQIQITADAPPPPVSTEPHIVTIEDLEQAWARAHTLTELDPIAQTLAELGTPESVQLLLTSIKKIRDWQTRAALAKNLRAVSNPEVLQVLLPALLENYGRGNTILNEISDSIARLAQPETVEDLAALHWQASVQAGQGHKVLRTVACIRNPVAIRGLMKVASRENSPAFIAAANEALSAMRNDASL